LARQADVRVDEVPDPKIEQPSDAIIGGTSTAICGWKAMTSSPRSARRPTAVAPTRQRRQHA
jgi:threonine dehydrogenase-like Zn-dependent dehydrogenase